MTGRDGKDTSLCDFVVWYFSVDYNSIRTPSSISKFICKVGVGCSLTVFVSCVITNI